MKTLKVSSTVWLGIMIIIITLKPAVAQSGCDLGFLPGAAPVIDGAIGNNEWSDAQHTVSGACLGALPDGTSLMSISATLPAHNVTVHTKRDGTTLYLAFDVSDQTVPPLTGIGEKLVLLLDPDHSRSAIPQATDFRLEFINFRGSPLSDSAKWFIGTGSAVGTHWVPKPLAGGSPGDLPPGVKVQKGNRLSGTPGYIVEISISLAEIGYPPAGAAVPFPDIGFAFAIINDLAFQAQLVPGEGNVEVLTGVAYPDTATLHLTNASNVLLDSGATVNGEWDKTSNWASAFLIGSGDSIFFLNTSDTWHHTDIRVGFVSATSFSDAGSPSTGNKWYKYQANPCPLRLWAKIHRRGTGVGVIRRRVLFLWADYANNPLRWHYIKVTDPVPIQPVAAGVSEMTVITPGFEWNQVPKNLINHPCIGAFILPETLASPVDLAFLQGIGDASDPGNNIDKVTKVIDTYGLTQAQTAQMNIDPVVTFTCPSAIPCPDCAASSGTPLSNLLASLGPPILMDTPSASANLQDQDQPNTHDIIIDIAVFGVVTPNARRKYAFVEPMGGVQKLIDPDYLKNVLRDRQSLSIPFNLSNSIDQPRRLFVVINQTVPPGVDPITVSIQQPSGTFAPGETRKVAATLKSGSPQQNILNRWGVSLHAGVSIPHGDFNTVFNPGPNFGVDLEYRVTRIFSLEGIYGFHHFTGETLGTVTVGNLNVHQFSFNGKVYGSTSPVRPFFNFGGGAYVFTPGTSTHGGLNVGGGVQFDVTPTFAVDAMYNFHNVFTSGSNTQFSTVQGGVRFRF